MPSATLFRTAARRLIAVSVVTALAVTGALTGAGAAVASGTGSISGTISSSSGSLPTSMILDAYRNGDDTLYSGTYNASTGGYAFSGLDAGIYVIEYIPSGDFVRGSTGGANRVGEIDVTTGALSTHDFTVQLGGRISGEILRDAGQAPITEVTLETVSGIGVTSADITGSSYLISAIAPGSYKIRYAAYNESFANLGSGYIGGATLAAARVFTVTAGSSEVVDVDLDPIRSISGAVSAGAGALPDHVDFTVWDADGNTVAPTSYTYSYSSASGSYSITGLASGTYRVQFNPSNTSGGPPFYVATFVGGNSLASATPIVVDNAQSADADILLVLGGSIAGTVTFAAALPSSMNFQLTDLSGGVVDAPRSFDPGTGVFSFTAVPPGTYTLRFSGGAAHLPGAYPTPIVVSAGGSTPLQPITLDPGATISGIISVLSGESRPPSVTFGLFDSNDSLVTPKSTSYVPATGAYSLTGIPAGTYTLRVSAAPALGFIRYVSSPFLVGTGTVSHTVPLSRGSTVSGLVSSGGVGLPNALVEVVTNDATGAVVATGETDSTGVYTVYGIPLGFHTLRFSALGYGTVWDGNVPVRSAGATLALFTRTDVTGRDATLERATGTVSATLVVESAPLAGAVVVPYRKVDTSWVAYSEQAATSNASGQISISGLPAATYRFKVLPTALSAPADSVVVAEQWIAAGATTIAGSPLGDRALAIDAATALNTVSLIRAATVDVAVSNGAELGGLPAALRLTIFDPLTPGEFTDLGAVVGTGGHYRFTRVPIGTWSFGVAITGSSDAFSFDAPSFSSASHVVGSGVTTFPLTLKQHVSPVTPTVSGTAQPGSSLTAVPGSWTPTTVTFSYQWLRDGVPITGATASTYLVSTADVDHSVSVSVTGSRTAPVDSQTRVSSAVAVTAVPVPPVVQQPEPTPPVAVVPTPLTFTKATTPKIIGTAKVGKELRVKPNWKVEGVSFRYAWFANGKPIAKAKKATLTLTKALKGKRITVRITGSKSGYMTLSKASAAVKVR